MYGHLHNRFTLHAESYILFPSKYLSRIGGAFPYWYHPQKQMNCCKYIDPAMLIIIPLSLTFNWMQKLSRFKYLSISIPQSYCFFITRIICISCLSRCIKAVAVIIVQW